MNTLPANADIHTIAKFIEQHIVANWQASFDAVQAEMAERYAEIGDSVYAIYGKHLFKPLQAALKEACLRHVPRLPFGGFMASREWGSEDNRERWFWSKISRADGSAAGTIALAFYHDHINLRIPGPPRVIPLEVTTKGAVIAALSRISPDFATAQDAKTEIAEYMQQMSAAGS